jgi:hypothetical protein
MRTIAGSAANAFNSDGETLAANVGVIWNRTRPRWNPWPSLGLVALPKCDAMIGFPVPQFQP